MERRPLRPAHRTDNARATLQIFLDQGQPEAARCSDNQGRVGRRNGHGGPPWVNRRILQRSRIPSRPVPMLFPPSSLHDELWARVRPEAGVFARPDFLVRPDLQPALPALVTPGPLVASQCLQLYRFLDAGSTETFRMRSWPASKKRRGAKSREGRASPLAHARSGLERSDFVRCPAPVLRLLRSILLSRGVTPLFAPPAPGRPPLRCQVIEPCSRASFGPADTRHNAQTAALFEAARSSERRHRKKQR